MCEGCALKRQKNERRLIVKPIVSKRYNSRAQVDLIDWQAVCTLPNAPNFILTFEGLPEPGLPCKSRLSPLKFSMKISKGMWLTSGRPCLSTISPSSHAYALCTTRPERRLPTSLRTSFMNSDRRIYYRWVILYFCPTLSKAQLCSDNGAEFKNKTLSRLLAKWKVVEIHGKPKSSQSQGEGFD
jgi:hypothetical protein